MKGQELEDFIDTLPDIAVYTDFESRDNFSNFAEEAFECK